MIRKKQPSPNDMLRGAQRVLQAAKRARNFEAIAVAQQLVRVLERRAARASSMPVAERSVPSVTENTIGSGDALDGRSGDTRAIPTPMGSRSP